MPRPSLSLHVDDLTKFVRVLSKQLGPNSPSHLTLMNMVARAGGYQNLQHMRASKAASLRLESRAEPVSADARAVERALHQFDQTARLIQWPSKRAVQTLALWAIWSVLPAHRSMTEGEVNSRLSDEHHFSDPATLRRTMIACGLLARERDGSEYRRLEQEPPAEAKALIRFLSSRRASRKGEAAQGKLAQLTIEPGR